MKTLSFDLGCNFQESHWSRSHGAGQDYVGRDVVLIGEYAERVRVTLLGSEKNAEASGVGIVDQKVGALAYLRQRRFLGCADVVEIAGIADQNAAFRLH